MFEFGVVGMDEFSVVFAVEDIRRGDERVESELRLSHSRRNY